MRAVNKAVFQLIPIPVATPAVVGVQAFPIVSQDLDPAPFQAEPTGQENVEVYRQAAEVLTREGLAQPLIEQALLLFAPVRWLSYWT